ncbi:hypothetical protein KG086_13500 [Lacticaseibacillus chiayiensis]|uniref:HNH endonuclease n=1 Tax=Lacticaseibacillus chiayiensis TaxID=2100821 RepID=A0ABY6H5W1_9LACO|nr:HNH endonuclease [Lacticaseibacillus chiayiensis]QVI34750.1 hypothetical protein KG086_13500 [Lacticaseibacillus chiayiensis]UYN56503.1 HNH endonuclease [Lacticaseibacillus chiayiensis]
MKKCLFCNQPLDGSKEHIIPAAFAGKKTCSSIICKKTNNLLGRYIDSVSDDFSPLLLMQGFVSDRNKSKKKAKQKKIEVRGKFKVNGKTYESEFLWSPRTLENPSGDLRLKHDVKGDNFIIKSKGSNNTGRKKNQNLDLKVSKKVITLDRFNLRNSVDLIRLRLEVMKIFCEFCYSVGLPVSPLNHYIRLINLYISAKGHIRDDLKKEIEEAVPWSPIFEPKINFQNFVVFYTPIYCPENCKLYAEVRFIGGFSFLISASFKATPISDAKLKKITPQCTMFKHL